MRSTNQREICILDLGPLKTEFCLSQFAWGGGGGGGGGGGWEMGVERREGGVNRVAHFITVMNRLN